MEEFSPKVPKKMDKGRIFLIFLLIGNQKRTEEYGTHINLALSSDNCAREVKYEPFFSESKNLIIPGGNWFRLIREAKELFLKCAQEKNDSEFLQAVEEIERWKRGTGKILGNMKKRK